LLETEGKDTLLTLLKTAPEIPPGLPFWSVPADALLEQLRTTAQGLTGAEARKRLQASAASRLESRWRAGPLLLLLSQFQSPIILLLLFAAGLSLWLGAHTDATIILIIVIVSGLLGFWQEYGAENAVEQLLAVVQLKALVRRDGPEQEIPIEDVVSGDIVLLNAGDVLPGDCRILESKDLFVDEAALTGETFPAEKGAGLLPAETPLSHRSNSLYMGTHVISGTATALVCRTGKETEFGALSERLRLRPPLTEFERGVRRFGYLLMEVTLLLVIFIFAVNVYLHRPVLESFLFALALAVGLTPQLLPAIISVNLAHGARRMAANKVIVKRLASIENFGSMDVFCSDKTGTLTESTVKLHAALDVNGGESERVLLFATLNATFQSGYANPIDDAIRADGKLDITAYSKLDEVPYDFTRKRLSVLVAHAGQRLVITKGALANVLEVCASMEPPDGSVNPIAPQNAQIQRQYAQLSGEGFRVLGIAYRPFETDCPLTREAEQGMIFAGFLALFGPLKAGIAETIGRLESLGIALKIITGDNALVAARISRQAGVSSPRLLTGAEMQRMSDAALMARAGKTDVFAEVEPNQKERIVHALRKAGYVVGYMGDGINDVSALHAADVSISVSEAVDVAKEAADIVLLEKDLAVLERGVIEGRTTFANTLKYVFMATSANFGNMFSMAGASLFLPFLPLLPTQILLTNLLTDVPEMTIATDSVDSEMVDRPRRWDIGFIRRFMVVFGLANSACDYLTFGVLLLLLHATPQQFRTGWFMENVVTAALIVLVIRTRRPFYRSRPSRYLLLATLAVVTLVLIFPWTPLGSLFGFKPLSLLFLFALGLIMLFYIVVAEIAKRFFYQRQP